jgi:hypothetical protein
VAVMGISYFAINAWRVAALRPPSLAAIVPWEGAVDSYRDISVTAACSPAASSAGGRQLDREHGEAAGKCRCRPRVRPPHVITTPTSRPSRPAAVGGQLGGAGLPAATSRASGTPAQSKRCGCTAATTCRRSMPWTGGSSSALEHWLRTST